MSDIVQDELTQERKIDATEREAVYDLLKPHLSFRPKPYLLIRF